MNPRSQAEPASGEAGFTLIETLIAIVILVFGLVGVTNLMVVAASANSVANHGTAATGEATEVMERLKAIPFTTLTATAAGDVAEVFTDDKGSDPGCDEAEDDCVVAGNFNAVRTISGVGPIKTRWLIVAIDPSTFFIQVRSEGVSALVRTRSRTEFTTFRTCTAADIGCPL